MTTYRNELPHQNEPENTFYRLTEKCWLMLGLAVLAWTGFQCAAAVANLVWGTHFELTLPISVRAWLVAFILGAGLSLILESWDQFGGGWPRALWWTPFAAVLVAFWLYLTL